MDSMEVLKNLSNDQSELFQKLEALFDSDGWTVVETWAKNKAEAARNRAAYASSWEENRMAVGAEAVYNEFANLPSSTMNDFEAMAMANVEKEEDEHADSMVAHQS